MKLPRPYIPLSVRLEVAKRQVLLDSSKYWLKAMMLPGKPTRVHLKILLHWLFRDEPFQLDHDPPLMLRDIIKTRDGKIKYLPDANDPNFLTYVNAESHRVKTFIKGEGARRSDMGQRRYLKRVHAKRNPKPRFKPRAVKHIRRISNASLTTKHGGKAE